MKLDFVHRRSPRSTWHVERWQEKPIATVMYYNILYSPVVKSLLGLKKLPERFTLTAKPGDSFRVVEIGTNENKIDGLFGQKMYGEGWVNVRNKRDQELLLLSRDMLTDLGIEIRLGTGFDLVVTDVSYKRSNQIADHKQIQKAAHLKRDE